MKALEQRAIKLAGWRERTNSAASSSSSTREGKRERRGADGVVDVEALFSCSS